MDTKNSTVLVLNELKGYITVSLCTQIVSGKEFFFGTDERSKENSSSTTVQAANESLGVGFALLTCVEAESAGIKTESTNWVKITPIKEIIFSAPVNSRLFQFMRIRRRRDLKMCYVLIRFTTSTRNTGHTVEKNSSVETIHKYTCSGPLVFAKCWAPNPYTCVYHTHKEIITVKYVKDAQSSEYTTEVTMLDFSTVLPYIRLVANVEKFCEWIYYAVSSKEQERQEE